MRRKQKVRIEKKYKVLYELLYSKVFGRCNRPFDLILTIDACRKYHNEIKRMKEYSLAMCPYEFQTNCPETIDDLTEELHYISDRFGAGHRLDLMEKAPMFHDELLIKELLDKTPILIDRRIKLSINKP